jgi:hypothetical protein
LEEALLGRIQRRITRELSTAILVFTFKHLEAFLIRYSVLGAELLYKTNASVKWHRNLRHSSWILVPLLATVQLQRNPNEVQICDVQKMNVTKTKMRLQRSKAHQNWRRIRIHTSAKISFTRISWRHDHPTLKPSMLQLSA